MQPVHALSLLVTVLAAGASAQEVRITNIRDVQGLPTARQYEKVEIAFDVEGAAEANPYLPYDLEPAPGLVTGVGITVDGLFLPPDQTDWSQAIIQPAFHYQAMKEDMPGGVGYPLGDACWKVRFAPGTVGKWQWRIRVQDATVCQAGRQPDRWVQSEAREFVVTQAEATNRGYVKVSPHDSRYFGFNDGTDFLGLGLAAGAWDVTRDPRAYFEDVSRHGIDFIRVWMCSDLIVGRGTHGWDPWRGVESRDRVGAAGGVTPYRYHDFSVRLTGNGRHIAITGNQPIKTWLEKDTRYILRIRAKLDQVVAASEPGGLVVKFLNDPYNDDFLSEKNSKLLITPEGWKGTTDWQVFEVPFVNPFGRRPIAHGAGLAIGLQDVSSGSVYLDEIYLGEDLGEGRIGPNILFKGRLNYHLYFDQTASYIWDRVFDTAQSYGVYIKPVILEKNDPIYNGISRADGVFRPIEKENDNFYAGAGTKVRRLHEYYWRYLAARWGYCTAIHSWELLNEGDPGSRLHYDQADALKRAVDRWDRNHMASTSFWHSFPTEFWRQTPCDYADVHAYISTTYAPKTERPVMQQDAAWYRLWHSRDIFTNRNPGKPVILGEAGLDFPDRQDRNPLLEKDKQGVWFHNFLWAGLDAGGLYQIYWWTEDLTNKKVGFDHREEFARLKRFLADLDLAGGGYQDWAGECDNPNVRVLGQKNLAKGRFHLWLQNKQHTWKNVVEGRTLDTQSAGITIPGFEPGTTFRVEWWDPWTGAVIETQQINAMDELVVRPPQGIEKDVAVKGYSVQREVPRREGQQ